MKIFSMSWCVRRPPPPCASTMRSSATRGTGQLRLNEVVLASAIVIVGRARAFRRYHGSAEWILRRALHGKRRALVRLFDALQNQSADALRRFFGRFTGEREAAIGIIFLKASFELEAARGNFAETAPLARNNLKNLCNRLLCWAVPFPANRAHILIFDIVAAFFELAHRHVDAFEQIERLESSHNDGNFVFFGD